MSNRKLLEILDHEGVQKLINMALNASECCNSNTEIIERLKEQLREKEGPSSPWKQLQIEL